MKYILILLLLFNSLPIPAQETKNEFGGPPVPPLPPLPPGFSSGPKAKDPQGGIPVPELPGLDFLGNNANPKEPKITRPPLTTGEMQVQMRIARLGKRVDKETRAQLMDYLSDSSANPAPSGDRINEDVKEKIFDDFLDIVGPKDTDKPLSDLDSEVIDHLKLQVDSFDPRRDLPKIKEQIKQTYLKGQKLLSKVKDPKGMIRPQFELLMNNHRLMANYLKVMDGLDNCSAQLDKNKHIPERIGEAVTVQFLRTNPCEQSIWQDHRPLDGPLEKFTKLREFLDESEQKSLPDDQQMALELEKLKKADFTKKGVGLKPQSFGDFKDDFIFHSISNNLKSLLAMGHAYNPNILPQGLDTPNFKGEVEQLMNLYCSKSAYSPSKNPCELSTGLKERLLKQFQLDAPGIISAVKRTNHQESMNSINRSIQRINKTMEGPLPTRKTGTTFSFGSLFKAENPTEVTIANLRDKTPEEKERDKGKNLPPTTFERYQNYAKTYEEETSSGPGLLIRAMIAMQDKKDELKMKELHQDSVEKRDGQFYWKGIKEVKDKHVVERAVDDAIKSLFNSMKRHAQFSYEQDRERSEEKVAGDYLDKEAADNYNSMMLRTQPVAYGQALLDNPAYAEKACNEIKFHSAQLKEEKWWDDNYYASGMVIGVGVGLVVLSGGALLGAGALGYGLLGSSTLIGLGTTVLTSSTVLTAATTLGAAHLTWGINHYHNKQLIYKEIADGALSANSDQRSMQDVNEALKSLDKTYNHLIVDGIGVAIGAGGLKVVGLIGKGVLTGTSAARIKAASAFNEFLMQDTKLSRSLLSAISKGQKMTIALRTRIESMFTVLGGYGVNGATKYIALRNRFLELVQQSRYSPKFLSYAIDRIVQVGKQCAQATKACNELEELLEIYVRYGANKNPATMSEVLAFETKISQTTSQQVRDLSHLTSDPEKFIAEFKKLPETVQAENQELLQLVQEEFKRHSTARASGAGSSNPATLAETTDLSVQNQVKVLQEEPIIVEITDSKIQDFYVQRLYNLQVATDGGFSPVRLREVFNLGQLSTETKVGLLEVSMQRGASGADVVGAIAGTKNIVDRAALFAAKERQTKYVVPFLEMAEKEPQKVTEAFRKFIQKVRDEDPRAIADVSKAILQRGKFNLIGDDLVPLARGTKLREVVGVNRGYSSVEIEQWGLALEGNPKAAEYWFSQLSPRTITKILNSKECYPQDVADVLAALIKRKELSPLQEAKLLEKITDPVMKKEFSRLVEREHLLAEFFDPKKSKSGIKFLSAEERTRLNDLAFQRVGRSGPPQKLVSKKKVVFEEREPFGIAPDGKVFITVDFLEKNPEMIRAFSKSPKVDEVLTKLIAKYPEDPMLARALGEPKHLELLKKSGALTEKEIAKKYKVGWSARKDFSATHGFKASSVPAGQSVEEAAEIYIRANPNTLLAFLNDGALVGGLVQAEQNLKSAVMMRLLKKGDVDPVYLESALHYMNNPVLRGKLQSFFYRSEVDIGYWR